MSDAARVTVIDPDTDRMIYMTGPVKETTVISGSEKQVFCFIGEINWRVTYKGIRQPP